MSVFILFDAGEFGGPGNVIRGVFDRSVDAVDEAQRIVDNETFEAWKNYKMVHGRKIYIVEVATNKIVYCDRAAYTVVVSQCNESLPVPSAYKQAFNEYLRDE